MLKKLNPALTLARETGLGIVKALPANDISETTKPLQQIQADFIAQRFHVPAARASVVANIIFGERA